MTSSYHAHYQSSYAAPTYSPATAQAYAYPPIRYERPRVEIIIRIEPREPRRVRVFEYERRYEW